MSRRGGLGLSWVLYAASMLSCHPGMAEEKPKEPEKTQEAELADKAARFTQLFEHLKNSRFKILQIDSSKQYYDAGPPKTEKTGPEYIDGWKILATRALTQDDLGNVRSILMDPQAFETGAFACFDPGMALELNDEKPENKLVLLICLKCQQIEVFTAKDTHWFSLSKSGTKELLSIYENYFVGAAAK